MKYLSDVLCSMANVSKQNRPMECAAWFYDEPECPKTLIEK